MEDFKPYSAKAPSLPSNPDIIPQIEQGSFRQGRSVQEVGVLQSKNYIAGQQGWRLSTTEAEFNVTVTTGSIDIGGADSTSFHVDSSGNMWLGAATFASAPFRVSSAGALTVTGATITGSTLQTGSVGGNVNITSAYISLRDNTTEVGYLRGTGGTFGDAELSVGAINFGNGLARIVGDNTGIYIVADSSSRVVYIEGQGGVTIGASSELFVDQSLNNVTIGASSFTIPSNAGAPTGGSNNDMKLDTTNSRIYFKVSGTWKYAALT